MLRFDDSRAARTAHLLLVNVCSSAARQCEPQQAPSPQPAPRCPQPSRFRGQRPPRCRPRATALPSSSRRPTPTTRGVLQKYPGLLEVRPPPPNTAILPALAPPFEAKHQANLAVAKQGDAELLLMGDSITDFWRNAEGPFAGKPVLDKHFGQWKVANFGIAGDTTQGVLYRLQNGEGQGFSPRAVMLMIGTNNTARNTAAEISEGIGAIVQELQRDFPQAKILLLGVFPRGRPGDPVRATIAEINRTIAKLHDGNKVHYLDIGAQFVDGSGTIPADVMSDLLHPGPKGYEIWAQAVKEPLSRLMAGR